MKIDNKELTAEIIAAKKRYKGGDTLEHISAELATMIMALVDGYTSSGKFSGNTQEQIENARSGAYIKAMEAVNKFDPEKSDNGFAYLTQVTYYSIMTHFNKEKKQERNKNGLRSTIMDIIEPAEQQEEDND